MTSWEIRSLLPVGPMAIFSDVTYSKPTSAWLQGPFWKYFWNLRMENGLMKWTRNNDCDNFARAYAQAASDCHAVSLDPETSEGIAVGEFHYRQDKGGGHAIVCVITEKGLGFIEPQTNKQLILTPTEISSCFFVRF